MFDDIITKEEFEDFEAYYQLAILLGELINEGINEGKIKQLVQPLINLIEELYRVSIDSNVAELSAKMYYNKYAAYMRAGFDVDQAFQLLIADRQDFSKSISNLTNVRK